VLLRQVAPLLEIDNPLLSKIERGERIAKKEMISKLAIILRRGKESLLTIWLVDQIYDVVKDEHVANAAIKNVSRKIRKK
jgi:HTH-type transcriptional regulator, competence development regulator